MSLPGPLATARSVPLPRCCWVVEVPDPLRPQHVVRRAEAWRPGMTLGQLVPDGWDRDLVEVAIGGETLTPVDWRRELAPGESIVLARRYGSGALNASVSFWHNLLSGQYLRDLFSKAWGILSPQLDFRQPENNANPVYGWSRIRTNYNAAGLPHPVQYGRHRQGGQVVSAYVEVVDGATPTSYLYLLLVLSIGPIDAIGQYDTDRDDLTGDALPDGLQIDGNAAKNFDEVTAWVRLGTLSQDPITGFDTVRTQLSVDLPIENEAAATGNPPTTDWSQAATYDMPAGARADRAIVGLFFPGGLSQLDDSGAIKNLSVTLQVRYTELDDAGNAISDPVVAYFGADTFVIVKAKQSSAFTKQLQVALYDPATFTPPVLTNALRFSRTGHHSALLNGGINSPIAAHPEWKSGFTMEALSLLAVVQIRASHPVNALNGWMFSATGTFGGFFLYAKQTSPGVSSLVLQWSNGTTVQVAEAGEVLDDTPTLLGFTYAKAVGPGGTHRLRLYVDGQVASEVYSATPIKLSSNGIVWNYTPGASTSLDASYGEVDYDEWRLFDTELTPDQVAALQNSGDWLAGKPEDANLVLGLHMDQIVTGSGTTTPSYVAGQAGPAVQGPPTVVSGFVSDAFDNTVKRGRYRFEVQRTTTVKENLKKHDEVRFDHLIEILDQEVAYHGSALLALRIRASEQLSGSQPNVTPVLQGIARCPIWDGLNADAPTFTFAYSRNPAWQLAHFLLDPEIGGGGYFDVTAIDWPSFKAWADACDELVYDQKGVFTAAELSYSASEFGFDAAVYKVRLPTPRATHFIEGKEVRLSSLGSGEYPAGDFVLRQVVNIDDDFYELWFDWPAAVAAPSTNPFTDAAAAAVRGVEARHTCDVVLIDRDLKFWDAVNQFCAAGRAAPVRLGDKLRVKYEGPRQPSALFTPANMVAGTFRLTTTRAEEFFNSLVAEFQDEDLDWERNQIPRDHPSVQTSTSTDVIRRRTFDFRGMTRRSQVIREADYQLNVQHDVLFGCEFECGLDGTFVEPGDVVIVAHPMPDWATSGRTAAESETDEELYLDVPTIVGAKNLLGSTDELDDVTYWQRTGTNPPTLVSAVEPDPAGVAQAAVFDFGATQSLLRYTRALRAGTTYRASVYARVMDGLGAATVDLNCDTGSSALSVPDDGAWHRIDTGLVAGASGWLDIECTSRRLALAWAQLERSALTAYEAVDVPSDETIMAAVRNGDSDALAFAEIASQDWGAYAAGEVLPLAEALGFVPQAQWVWAVGPAATASLTFQVIDSPMTMDLKKRLSLVQYVESVYPDEDAYPTIPESLTATLETSALVLSGSMLPDLVGPVVVTEEAHEDPDTGTLTKGLSVSWRTDATTAQRVERTLIWLEEVGEGEPELVGQVVGAGTFFRVDGATRRLAAGIAYRVTIQPVTAGGARRALGRCRSALVTLAGLFPVPRVPPPAARAYLHGDEVTYRVDLPATFAGKVIELRRGGPWIGAEIGRIPVGGNSFGPTSDWCVLPTAADGRSQIPIMARLVGSNGGRGDFIRLTDVLAPAGFSDPALEASLEDGPFDTAPAGFTEAPVLTNLQLVDPSPHGLAQRLAWSGSGLTASYESTVFDLGEARRIHVSVGFDGLQVAPAAMEDLPEIEGPRMRSWTPEGHTDPSHPDYGKVDVELQWAFSLDSDDPGTDYLPFRPGVAYARSCRFRLALSRPSASWDVLIDRMAVAIRLLPPSDARNFDGGTITS